jgi:hypothetical protein
MSSVGGISVFSNTKGIAATEKYRQTGIFVWIVGKTTFQSIYPRCADRAASPGGSQCAGQAPRLWGRIVSCAPVFKRRWSGCLQAIPAGYQPDPEGTPANLPPFSPNSRFWEKYVALRKSACATRAKKL